MADDQLGGNLLIAFNRGLISPLALARVDVKRVALSGEIVTNWMFRVLGSMMLRPGTQYIGNTAGDNQAVYIPFVFNNSDTAMLEMTANQMRIWVNESIVTNAVVATAVTNGNFTSNITGWTSIDQSGTSSSWNAAGYMQFTGTGKNFAGRYQLVTVAAGDLNKRHNLRVQAIGRVVIKVGTVLGLDDYVSSFEMHTGEYSFSFTPVGNFYIQVQSLTTYVSYLDSVNVEASGIKVIPTPYTTSDLNSIRWEESADVLFVACDGFQQRRLLRFKKDSTAWGIDLYAPQDGPFRNENTSQVTLTPSGRNGNITITASQPTFYSLQIGALFYLTSFGQFVSGVPAGDDQFTNPIEITGVGSGQRTVGILIQGTWTGTITLQQSVGAPGSWVNISNYTTNQSTSYADGLDNQDIFYRIGFISGNYGTGSATVTLSNALGSITGVVQVTNFVSATSINCQVLVDLGNTTATTIWAEGAWSNYRGFPTAVALLEGRMWWAGRGNIWGSVSGIYESYDKGIINDTIGDAGPIIESIGSGPVDIIPWLLPLFRLVIGGQANEFSIHSSVTDQPLTPTNFIIRNETCQGSSNVIARKMDVDGFFINKTGTRLFFITLQNVYYSYNYTADDKTLYCPEILEMGVVRMDIQRIPETRVHCVCSDGSVGILVFDPLEKVEGWLKYTTDGIVEDVIVMPNPGQPEDKVYYVVKRTINGVTRRMLERWSLERECIGGTLNKNIDCHAIYNGVATTTLVAAHLPNTDVVAWGDGKTCGGLDANQDPIVYTTDGTGSFTVPVAVSSAVFGVPYMSQFKSSKLLGDAGGKLGLTEKSRMDHMSLVMRNTHYQGLKYGTSFDALDPLPLVENGAVTPDDTVWENYDHDAFEVNDIWDTDTRMCLQAQSPLPCTILAVVTKDKTNEKR